MALDYAKCYQDKTRILFTEKYLSTFDGSAQKNVPFKLFPRQKVFMRSLAENKSSIAIKHRQCGITTISSAWITGQCVFASPEAPETVLCIANKLEMANEILTKIRDFLLQVPRWYWGDEFYSIDPKSEKNMKDIFVKNSKSMLELHNGCKIYARSSGANAARGISSVSILIFDEAAFIEEGLAVYSSAVAATAAVPNAKIIMVSTPNGKDQLYYTTYKQALAKENGYNAVEFKWFQDLRYNRFLEWRKKDTTTGEYNVIKEEIIDDKGSVVYDEAHWRKMEEDGWSPMSPWYDSMCRSFNNDSVKIAQELDVSFLGSANNVIDAQYIEMQHQLNVREPLTEMIDPLTEETWFWKPPIEGHRYVCACLPQGEKVLTQRGEVNVEDVKSDDLLITKEGEFTKIKCRKYRYVEDEEIVSIKCHNFLDEIKFTHNHPIWSSLNTTVKKQYLNGKYLGRLINHDFSYNDASLITENTWLEVPNIYRSKSLSNEELLNIWHKYYDNNVILEEDFWWYCGVWLAEGYCKHGTNRICTVHNIAEVDIHNRIISIADKLFNRKANVYDKGNNSAAVYFEHKQLYIFLKDAFKGYAKNKEITEWIKFLPEKYKLQLFYGYYQGDGWIYKDCISTISVSKQLCKDFQDILFSIGIVNSIKVAKQEGKREIIKGKMSSCLTSYQIVISKEQTALFFKKLSKMENITVKGNRKFVYFSDDLSKIYVKVAKVEKYSYSGKVFNFETESESHSFCCRGIATHNCDPSRGTSEDKTSIEMIDLDGVDSNGFPIVEQVMEYNGKKLGDQIGQMVFQYATMYNNAFVVVDATGGQGDALLLTLINMGYKNMYYEDNSQKTYTVQNNSKDGKMDYNNRLPGFHFQGNRYAVLSTLAGMIRNNEFKVRSIRVINELETWIFKENGRIDHMTGAHDDNLCALAMGLFVMKYTLNKLQDVKKLDKAILSSYMVGGGYTQSRSYKDTVDMRPKNDMKLPFYNNNTFKKTNQQGDCMWLFSGMF